MYQENIRNLVAQRERESHQAMLSQTMSQKALQRIDMNQKKGSGNIHKLSQKQRQQIQSVIYNNLLIIF
jgi:hypothetical protein